MGDAIRSLLHRSSSCHQPWQLSAAIALGVVCGLLPKFSLLFCAIVVVCCALPIHLPLAACTCFMLSFAAGPLTQAAGRAGLWSLTNSSLVDMWSSVDQIPWLPWIGLNNSVVHGSFLIGLGIAVPVFFLSRPLAARLSPARSAASALAADPDFAQELKPAVAARKAVASSTALPCAPTRSETPVVSRLDEPTGPEQPVVVEWSGLSQRRTSDHAISVSVVDEHSCHELEKLLATCNAEQAHSVGPVQVAQRAAQMAQYVDDLLTSCDLHPTPSIAQALVDGPATTVEPTDAQQVTQGSDSAPTPAAEPPDGQVPTSANSSNSTRFIHQAQERNTVQPYIPTAGRARDSASPREPTHAGEVALRKDTGVAAASTRRPIGDTHQAETLRYLLEHLRAIQDKV